MNKSLKTIRSDVWDRFFALKKGFRFLKKAKIDLISNLNKLKFNGNGHFKYRLRKLLFRLGRRDKKDSFIRTKRKSFYGRSLLEKKKIRLLTINLNLKDYYSKYREKFVSKIASRPDYIFNILKVFDSPNSLKRNFVYKRPIFINSNKYINGSLDIGDCLSYSGLTNLFSFKIVKSSLKRKKIAIFKRVISNNLHFDIRVKKICLVDDKVGSVLLKHYRIKND